MVARGRKAIKKGIDIKTVHLSIALLGFVVKATVIAKDKPIGAKAVLINS